MHTKKQLQNSYKLQRTSGSSSTFGSSDEPCALWLHRASFDACEPLSREPVS